MLSVRRTARWGQCLCVLLLCGGCATVRVPMTIRHPAQIDMSSYKRVAVGKFGGDMGTRFRVAMETKFAESERFELVDRKNLDQMLNELRVSYSELSELDDDQRPRLGRILAASAIISGSATSDYSEHTTSEVETNKKTGKETVVYKRVGHASVMGSLDVIDVETGRVQKSLPLCAAERGASTGRGKMPGSPQSSLMDRAFRYFTRKAWKTISDWTETKKVPFATDKKLPLLEQGVRQAQIGELDEALDTFAAAAEAGLGSATVTGATVAKAHWNTGLVYAYTDRHDEAVAAFKEAFKLAPLKKYLKMLDEVKLRKEELERAARRTEAQR